MFMDKLYVNQTKTMRLLSSLDQEMMIKASLMDAKLSLILRQLMKDQENDYQILYIR